MVLRLCSIEHNRKNFLFAKTPRGAQASAIVYSIVETAKENGLNPRAYLQYLFAQLPNRDRKDPAIWDDLLPWSPALPPSSQPRDVDPRALGCAAYYLLRPDGARRRRQTPA